MSRSFKFGSLAAFGLAFVVPALSQTPGQNAVPAAALTRGVRVLPPEVSRSLKIVPNPNSSTALLIGTYWSCEDWNGHDFCWIKVVVCTDGQEYCVEMY